MQEINEKDFFINGKKEEIKEYQFFFEDGTSENCDFEESLKEKCYAYSMYSSITDNTKYFVKTKKGIFAKDIILSIVHYFIVFNTFNQIYFFITIF